MISNDRYYSKYAPIKLNGYSNITSGFLKNTLYNTLIEIQYRIISELVEDREITDDTYEDDSPYIPIFSRKNDKLSHSLYKRFNHIQKNYGTKESQSLITSADQFLETITNCNDTIILIEEFKTLLIKINKFIKFVDTNMDSYAWYVNKNNKLILFIDIAEKSNKNLNLNFPKLTNNQFINTNSLLSETIRHENRNPTIDEYFALQIASEMINERGCTESSIVPWGNSGFRKIQTQASITDPGLGHITGTTTKQKFINGTNVHVEFLERGTITDREKLEPYRLPDLRTIGKIKMLVGRDTSVSSYVGRPMFEDTFKNSFIKSVHTMIASCSAIFMNGLSECKIAIEKMTYTESVKFMQAISANVIRDHTLQVLAAAFCINYPIVDDREETIKKNNGKPPLITDPMEVAKLGIDITKDGNFEKVTFDGTADWYPSDPIMEQLGYKNALELVHTAHQNGLLTYFSAGFRFKHLEDIVLSGTDGIGLGGAQILRFMDKRNGNQGPFKKNNVPAILKINKQTENSPLGQGTQLLCRLDRMYYELSLPLKLVKAKEELYTALQEKNISKVKCILNSCQEIVSLRIDMAHPLLEWANRLINNKKDCLAFNHLTNNQKSSYISELNDSIISHDYEQLNNILYRIKVENI